MNQVKKPESKLNDIIQKIKRTVQTRRFLIYLGSFLLLILVLVGTYYLVSYTDHISTFVSKVPSNINPMKLMDNSKPTTYRYDKPSSLSSSNASGFMAKFINWIYSLFFFWRR